MRSCGALLAALVVDAAGHRAHFTVFETLRKKAHTKEESRLVDTLSALVEKGQATPGAMEDFGMAVYTAAQRIDADVLPLIEQAHVDTQAAITAALEEVERTTGVAVEKKGLADTADKQWNDCVAQEKTDRQAVETAEEELTAAEGRVQEPCDAETAAEPYSTQVILPSFSCDIEEEGGLCDTSKYKETAQGMLDEAKNDQQAKKKTYDDAVALCAEARDNVTKATEKKNAAIKTWQDQQGECVQLWGDRETALCDFGTSLGVKCAAVDAWGVLKEQSAGYGTEHSLAEREDEYSTAQIVQCLINGIAANPGSLDAEDYTACQKVNKHLDPLDWYVDRYEATMVENKFTCEEASIKFTGNLWTVPSGEAPDSESYVQDQAYEEVVESGHSFSFCQALPGK